MVLRIGSSSPQRLITYTWDARGNLIGDGTFTYAYNAAGKMVRAQSITATIAYTYTADGLRVGQAVAGAVTTYAWDWAAAVPELLSQSTNHQSTDHQSTTYYSVKADFSVWPDLRNTLLAGYVGL